MSTTKLFLHTPVPAPALNAPTGATVRVSVIDCAADFQVPIDLLMGPKQKGHDFITAPVFAFLIENGSRKILFDLGCRKDWDQLPPVVYDKLVLPGWKIDIKKGIAEILQDGGIDVAGGAIESMIWSHWHYDHIGDTSTFPGSTELVIARGVKDAFYPAYPGNPDSPLLESDFAGREVREIDFDTAPMKIGGYRAFDYFGDGSFYLLDAPGHAISNMCALARVTNDGESSWVLMGGDVAHHGAEFRPTQYLPLPAGITPSPLKGFPSICPGHIFEAIHPEKRGDKPFYHVFGDVPHNHEDAERSVETLEEFDASPDVFVVVAHDASLFHPEVGMKWFPRGSINDWKSKDLARKARWGFLRDFEDAVGQSEQIEAML